MPLTRRLVGLATLLALAAIALGVSGFELPLPGRQQPQTLLPGVRIAASDILVRPGAGAPPDSSLAFLALEPSGNLVVSDQKRNSILRFDPSGHLMSEWGPRLGNTMLAQPAGVAIQGDSFYVLDRAVPRILRLDVGGRVVSTIDLAPLGTYGLNGLAVDPDGNLYAADTGHNRILVFAPSGALIRQFGRGGADLGAFTQPMQLAFAPDGSLFVADWENGRIERWDSSFTATDAWTTGFRPFGVTVDSLGRVYAPDAEHAEVIAYTPRGAMLAELGGPGSLPIDVRPRQVALSRSDPLTLYALSDDGIARLVLANTAPPPQGGDEVDLASIVIIAVLLGGVAMAFASRRRRDRALLGAPLAGKVGLQAENGAQRKDQKARANQDLLITDQPERERQAADQHDQAEKNAEAHQHAS